MGCEYVRHYRFLATDSSTAYWRPTSKNMSFNSFKRFVEKQHSPKGRKGFDLEKGKDIFGMGDFLPKNYKTEEEKRLIEEAKQQEDLDLLKEKQNKALEN